MPSEILESSIYPFRIRCQICIDVIAETGYHGARCLKCLEKRNDPARVEFWLFNYQSPIKDKNPQPYIVSMYVRNVAISKVIREEVKSQSAMDKTKIARLIKVGLSQIPSFTDCNKRIPLQQVVDRLTGEVEEYVEDVHDVIYESILNSEVLKMEKKDTLFFYVPKSS